MKKTFLAILLCTISIFTYGDYQQNLPITITQPDGTAINCFATGDEFYNWAHDAEGYTIMQAPDGYYYYAIQDGNFPKPSIYLVNSVNPESVGLTKGVKISKQAYQQKINARSKAQSAYQSKPSYAPHAGTMNNLTVYIRFSDDAEFTTTRQTYDTNLNGTTGITLKSYYNEVSYNTLNINSTHYPACALSTNLSYQDSHPRKYFQPYNATTNPTGYSSDADKTSREHTLLVTAINWINTNSPVSASLNIDGDGDGKVDNVCFIIKGSSGGWNELLWAHRWSLYTQTVNINGKRVFGYTFQPENQVAVKTLCHEMFHALGSPDLYHYTDQGVFVPVGGWDLMESGGGHMLTYMKWKYSAQTWITSIPQITSTGTYTLNPASSSTNNCYKIASPYSANEYFMVEYRVKTGTFETNIPNTGLLVYRVDTRLNGNADGPPDEVYLYRPNGSKTVNGDVNLANFSATVGRTAISDGTNPSSFLQDGTGGGLHLSNVTTSGTTISFDVTFPTACTPPSTQASTFTPNSVTNNSMTIGWTRGNGNSVLVIARKGSAVTEAPLSGKAYVADAAFGNGSEIGIGNFVVYSGTGNSASISALQQGTTYYYAIYEFNSSSNCYMEPALFGNTSTTGATPSLITDYRPNKAQTLAGTYTDLGTNGTVITTANTDNANSDVQNIGFPFVYNNQTFTQFVLNTNGFIRLGDTPPSSASIFFDAAQAITGGVFNSTKPADTNIISPLNHDLTAGTNTPEYRVYTSGTSPNRICTIQYKNVREKTVNSQFDNMQFQVKLYETSKIIEFIYGDWTASTNASFWKSVACGLKGTSNTDNQLLTVTKGSTANWGTVSFANANYTGNTLNIGNGTRPKPDAGRTYRFSPISDNDLGVGEIYALGEASKFNSNPQNISVNISNTGKNNQTNIPVTLNCTGANSFTETKYIASLSADATTTVTFTNFAATSNGTTNITVTLPNDDYATDNTKTWIQNTNDNTCNYASTDAPSSGWGGTSAVAFYTKYHINGSAKVNSVNTFIYNHSNNVGNTVLGILLNSAGTVIGQSNSYVIQSTDLGKWHSFTINNPTTITDADYYAGFGVNSSSTAYYALGLQTQNPTRPDTYYYSALDGSGLKLQNTSTFFYRYMISATLTPIANGIEKTENNSSFKTYPNPVSNELNIEVEGNMEKVEIEILNAMGQTVYKNTMVEKTVIQMSTIPSGVYMIRLKKGNSYELKRIVKE